MNGLNTWLAWLPGEITAVDGYETPPPTHLSHTRPPHTYQRSTAVTLHCTNSHPPNPMTVLTNTSYQPPSPLAVTTPACLARRPRPPKRDPSRPGHCQWRRAKKNSPHTHRRSIPVTLYCSNSHPPNPMAVLTDTSYQPAHHRPPPHHPAWRAVPVHPNAIQAGPATASGGALLKNSPTNHHTSHCVHTF